MHVLLYSIFWLLSRGSCLFFFFTFSTVFSLYFSITYVSKSEATEASKKGKVTPSGWRSKRQEQMAEKRSPMFPQSEA